MTLLIWIECDAVTFYEIPDDLIEPYKECHGLILNARESQEEGANDLVEHLAIMLGKELWFGKIPTLAEWRELLKEHGPEIRSGEFRDQEANEDLTPTKAEWLQFELVVDSPFFPIKSNRVLLCGWEI